MMLGAALEGRGEAAMVGARLLYTRIYAVVHRHHDRGLLTHDGASGDRAGASIPRIK